MKPTREKSIVFNAFMLILALSVVAVFPPLTSRVEAMDGQAEVYVLRISGVGVCGVNKADDVAQGVMDACTPIGRTGNVPQVLLNYGKRPPYCKTTYSMITDWASYVNIIQSYTNIVVVNAHGEIVPVPSGYTHEDWVDKIAEAMFKRRLTWVNMAGYPFYWYWQQGATDKTMWGEGGFQKLMKNIEREGVNCSLPTSARPQMSSSAWTQLSSWTVLSNAKAVDLYRPLKKSDFQNYAVLPLYTYVYNSVEYWEGAVIAFAKPGSRLSTNGFGYYVHLGTSQTYDASGRPSNGDRYRAYVATAAAIWAEALQGKPNSYVYIDPDFGRHLSLHVNPLVLGSWTDAGGAIHARIAFGIYGTLCSSYNDANMFGNIVAYAGSEFRQGEGDYDKIKMQAQTGLYGTQPMCRNGRDVGIQPITGVPFYDAGTSWLADGFIFLLGLWAETEPLALALGGVKLFADWIQLGIRDSTAGVRQQDSWVYFWYEPQACYTIVGDKWYGEFESLVVIDVSVQGSYGGDWRVIPIDYGFRMNSYYGKAIDVDGCMSLAMWFGSGDTVTVFYDDFEDSFDGWTTADNNAVSDYDYWGIISDPAEAKPSYVWCATIGDNSIYGVPNTEAGSPDNPRYDSNMDTYLRLDLGSLKSLAYQNFTLRFIIYHELESGDYLNLNIYVGGTGWTTLWTYTGNSPGFNWCFQSFAMPRWTTMLEFRFYSNGDAYVNHGASIDDIEILGKVPNDAPNTANLDAGNTYDTATSMGISGGYGYLNGELDLEDWYVFYVPRNYVIVINLYSQPNVVFYVEIWDKGGKAEAGPSTTGVGYLTSSTGDIRARIYIGQGFGSYSFSVSIYRWGKK